MRCFKMQWAYALVVFLFCRVSPAQDFPKITSREIKKINGKEIELVTANGIKAIVAPKDETSLSLSENLRIKHKNFLTFNEMLPSMVLVEGKVYYLENKRKAAVVEYHTTMERETLWDISQKYGVRLASLVTFNRMRAGEQPQAGRVIWLAKKRPTSVPIEIKKIPEPAIDTKPKEPSTQKTDSAKFASLQVPSEYYMTQEGQTIPQIAAKLKMSEDSLYKLNPYVSRNTPPAPGTILRVRPAITQDQFNQTNQPSTQLKIDTSNVRNRLSVSLDSIVSKKPGRKSHYVMSGETLQGVAANYRLSPGDLVKWNDLRESMLRPGQILFLEPEPQFKTPSREEVIAALDSGKHIVLPGQTLQSIAGDYGVKEKDLIEWNKLSPNQNLKPGQRLYIDAGSVPASVVTDTKKMIQPTETFLTNTSGEPVYHKVAAGEGLWSISNRYKAKVTDVQKWNDLKGNEIRVGQRLIVGYQAAGTSNTPVQQFSQPQSFKMPTQTEIDAAFNEGQHIVLPNENPTSVAAKYNVKVEEFCKWNSITPTTQLTPGQRLYYDADAVPASSPSSTAAGQSNKSQVNSTQPTAGSVTKSQPISGGFEPVFHKVASSEGLWRISKTYNTTTVEIRKWNSLSTDEIRAGQQLVVGIKQTQPQFHKVSSGEDMTSIAKKYNLTEGWLIYLNGGMPNLTVGSNVKVK